jgi:hypothetical protein
VLSARYELYLYIQYGLSSVFTTREVRVRSRANPYDICDTKVALGHVFLRVIQFSPQFYSTDIPYSFLSLLWACGGAVGWGTGGSIPDGVVGIFHWRNPSSRTMALGFDSISNRNEYQEYVLVSKGGRCPGLTTLPASYANCLEIWEPEPPGIRGPIQACNGIALPLSSCYSHQKDKRRRLGTF